MPSQCLPTDGPSSLTSAIKHKVCLWLGDYMGEIDPFQER